MTKKPGYIPNSIEPKKPMCEWLIILDDGVLNCANQGWYTSCGNRMFFWDGDGIDPTYKFCQYCGGEIAIKKR